MIFNNFEIHRALMVNIVITSNLADELLAKLMIGLVLATQEWLSMLGEKLSMLGGKS